MTKVAILAFDDSLASSIAGSIEMFSIANTHAMLNKDFETDEEPFSWSIISVDGRPVKTSIGLVITVDGDLSSAEDADIFLVPAFNHSYGNEVVDFIMGIPDKDIEWIKTKHANGMMIGANCSGVFLIAECGILDGKKATTSWWLAKHFVNRYPQVELILSKVLTEDENVICSGAITSYLYMCIQLIEKFTNAELANRVKKTMLINTKELTQAPYLTTRSTLLMPDSMVEQAINWMGENLNKKVSLDEIASLFAVTTRTFIRRFNRAAGQPPKQFLTRLRIDEAKRLLESTDLGLEQIVDQVGYSDVSSFRRLFRREIHMSPFEYRKRFSYSSV